MQFPPFTRKAAQAAFLTYALGLPALDLGAVAGEQAAPSALDGAQLGAFLGADETALQQVFPELRKTRRPVAGPHGARGLWTLSEDTVAGMKFESVFFFKAHRLERIEQRRLAAPTLCTQQFDQLTAALELRMGAAVRSSDAPASGSRSAAWSMETYRVAAFQTPTAGACTVMLVHEPLSTKDASEL